MIGEFRLGDLRAMAQAHLPIPAASALELIEEIDLLRARLVESYVERPEWQEFIADRIAKRAAAKFHLYGPGTTPRSIYLQNVYRSVQQAVRDSMAIEGLGSLVLLQKAEIRFVALRADLQPLLGGPMVEAAKGAPGDAEEQGAGSVSR